jgi:hypothetical protein
LTYRCCQASIIPTKSTTIFDHHYFRNAPKYSQQQVRQCRPLFQQMQSNLIPLTILPSPREVSNLQTKEEAAPLISSVDSQVSADDWALLFPFVLVNY